MEDYYGFGNTGKKTSPVPVMDRRDFIKITSGAAMTLALSPLALTSCGGMTMQKRTLGRTGEKVSIITVGGLHMSWIETPDGHIDVAEQEGIGIVRGAIDAGVNFCDNAWSYNNGRSEELMGKSLKDGYREKAMIMTKLTGRTPARLQEQLETSLKRYQVDYIDVMQFHVIGMWNGDVDAVYERGLLEWAVKKKEEGLIRFIGFTGHNDPDAHMDMINRGFEWDTCQFPINLADYNNPGKSFERDVLPLCNEKNIGVIAMKSNGYGRDWYKDYATPVEGLRYAMSMNVATVASGMTSLPIMEENVAATLNFKPFSKKELAEYRSRLDEYPEKLEHYRTEPFDPPERVL
jgi:predicted aldo/keto reductase-like oxidoreductase